MKDPTTTKPYTTKWGQLHESHDVISRFLFKDKESI